MMISTILSCSCSLVEANERIILYTCFTFPRSLEGTWDLLEKLKYVKNIYNGEKIIFALLIGIICILIKHYNEKIPENYRYFYRVAFGK
jgi:hypothetical protein